MQTDNFLTLPDGRTLAYAEYGQPDGFPVLYFHAAPSARLEPLTIGDDVFRRYGLCVVAPDRPGIGASDFQPKREFSDWPKDVEFLADSIGLDKFAVLGVSGGCGYAAVCAAKIPDRLLSVAIASGAWRIDAKDAKAIGFPMNLMWRVSIYAPFLLSPMLKMMIKLMTQPPKEGNRPASTPPNNIMPPADHAVMAQPGRIEMNQRVMKEVLKQGSKGAVWDTRLITREWDFHPADIQIPLVLFHGEEDRNYPVTLVRRMANILPNAQLITYPEDGHVSTYINHFDEIAIALRGDKS